MSLKQNIKDYFKPFKFPQVSSTREQELEQLVREMYEWTKHKNTNWAIRAKKALKES